MGLDRVVQPLLSYKTQLILDFKIFALEIAPKGGIIFIK